MALPGVCVSERDGNSVVRELKNKLYKRLMNARMHTLALCSYTSTVVSGHGLITGRIEGSTLWWTMICYS